MTVSTLPDPGRRPRYDDFNALPVRSTVADRYAGIARRVDVRGSGTVDLYAANTQGFRLSAGSHYRQQYSPPERGPGAISSSAATMRLPGGAVNLRDGYERLAPVAMAGYDAAVSDRLKLGVEGGMMLGRAAGNYAISPSSLQESRTRSNPVADVVMTYAF